MPKTEFSKEELAVFLKDRVQDVSGGRYEAFHASEDRLLVIAPTKSTRTRKQTPVMTTIIFVIILMSALLAFLVKPPQPMVLILGIVVAAVIYVATRYGGIGQAGLDLYGFVRDVDRKEASELLENIEKTHRVHLPLIPCQRWHWGIEEIDRP